MQSFAAALLQQPLACSRAIEAGLRGVAVAAVSWGLGTQVLHPFSVEVCKGVADAADNWVTTAAAAEGGSINSNNGSCGIADSSSSQDPVLHPQVQLQLFAMLMTCL